MPESNGIPIKDVMFNVQYSAPSNGLNAGGFTRPYSSDGRISQEDLSSWQAENMFFAFDWERNSDHPPLQVREKGGGITKEIFRSVTFKRLHTSALFFLSNDSYGTVLLPAGLPVGGRLSLDGCNDEPTAEQVRSWLADNGFSPAVRAPE